MNFLSHFEQIQFISLSNVPNLTSACFGAFGNCIDLIPTNNQCLVTLILIATSMIMHLNPTVHISSDHVKLSFYGDLLTIN